MNAEAPGPARFTDRVVIVTGGASGIGEATVHRFAAEGAKVLLVDIDTTGAARVAGDAAGHAGEVAVCIADICTTEGIERMVADSVARWDRLDVVVNNAVSPEVGPVLEHTEAGWQRTFDSSVTAVWRSARAAVPVMAADGGGVFVNSHQRRAGRGARARAYGEAKAG